MKVSKLVLFVAFGLLLVGCGSSENNTSSGNNGGSNYNFGGSDDNTNSPVDTTIWETFSKKHFAYNFKKSDLINYFKTNGTAYAGGYRIQNGVNVAYNEIDYFPDEDKFIIGKYVKETSTISNITTVTEFIGSSTVYHYKSLSKGTFTGRWTGTNLTSQGVITSAEEGSYKYTISQIGDGYKLSEFSKVSVQKSETSSKITNEIRQKVYNCLSASWTFASNTFKKIKSSVPLTNDYNASDWSSIDWSKVKFSDTTVKYDNKSHSITVENVPEGVSVTYSGNEQTTPGAHTITANFYDPVDNKIKTLTSSLTIDDNFKLTFKYVYGSTNSYNTHGGYPLKSVTVDAKYGAEILPLAQANVPRGYVLQTQIYGQWGSEKVDAEYNWSGYEDQEITIYCEAEYENYMYVESTNNLIDKKYIPVSVLKNHLQSSSTQTTYAKGDTTPLTFVFEDITKIKFCNSLNFDVTFPSFNKYSSGGLKNLTTVDISEMKFVKSIPDNFFICAESLITIIGEDMEMLTTIGSNFLRNSNIINFNLDLSNITGIGNHFLYNAFNGSEARNVTLDFKSLNVINGLQSTGTKLSNYYGSVDNTSFLWQTSMQDNSHLTIIMYDFLLTDTFFYDGNSNSDNSGITINDRYGKHYNLTIKTSYKTQQESLLTKLQGNVSIESI